MLFYFASCSSEGTQEKHPENKVLEEDLTVKTTDYSSIFEEINAVFEQKVDSIPVEYLEFLDVGTSIKGIPIIADSMLRFDDYNIYFMRNWTGSRDDYSLMSFHIRIFDSLGEFRGKEDLKLIYEGVQTEIVSQKYISYSNYYTEFSWTGEGAVMTEDIINRNEFYKFSEFGIQHIETLPKRELSYFRNEIYARKGKIFEEAKTQALFENEEWYKPKFKNVNAFLSTQEKELIHQLNRLEKNH